MTSDSAKPILALLVAGAGCAPAVDYAALAAAQGHPGGPWVSTTACGAGDLEGCRDRCSREKQMDACNNLGVILERHDDPGAGASSLMLYRTACLMGSAGACYNEKRARAGRSLEATLEDDSRRTQDRVREMARSRVLGTVEVDGASFQVTTCHSGDPHGFFGVDLDGSDRRRLRLVSEIDGTTTLVLFEANAEAGQSVKGCAKGKFEATGMEINGVRVVAGVARLACTTPVSVAGEVTFRCGL
jgi:hypothetical protein